MTLLNDILKGVNEGKQGLIIGALVGATAGYLFRNSVNITLFQTQGLIDTVTAIQPTTRLIVVLGIVGAIIGIAADLNSDKLKGVFK